MICFVVCLYFALGIIVSVCSFSRSDIFLSADVHILKLAILARECYPFTDTEPKQSCIDNLALIYGVRPCSDILHQCTAMFFSTSEIERILSSF